MSDLKSFFSINGRATRKQYWMFMLVVVLLYLTIGLVDSFLDLYVESVQMGILELIFTLIVIIPSLVISIRRLHDFGWNGWWLLLVLIPLVGLVFTLVIGLIDSQRGTNQYGESSKYPEQDIVLSQDSVDLA